MAATLSQNFIMQPAKPGQQASPMQNSNVTNVPAEAYQTYMKIIDPDGIYLNKLSRLLYSAYLVKSDIPDPKSPVPGYKLIEMNSAEIGVARKTLVSWDAYNTITNNYLLLVSEAISTTEFDVKEINLKKLCIDGVWSIIVQLVTNWEDWEFDDPAEIMPLGISMWFNLYAISRRSTGGGKMLAFLTNLFKYLGVHRKEDEDDASKVKFWRSNGNNT